MFTSARPFAAAALVTLLAAPAAAGEITLQIANGLVTLHARDATVREILAEWARIGQTRIVNGERVPGGPVTLQLNGVPERQALDILLRTASGYLAAPRPVATANASVFDRILVLPTSSPPPVPASQTSRPPPAIFAPAPAPVGDPSDLNPDEPDDDPPGAPGMQGPNRPPFRFFPAQPAGQAPGQPPFGMPAGAQPFGTPVSPPAENAVEPVNMFTEPPAAAAPANPFGIPTGTSAVPGIIVLPPAPGQPPQGTAPRFLPQ